MGKNRVWENERVKEYLLHYFNLISQKDIAYYLLCKKIAVDFDPKDSLENLFKLHKKNKKDFQQIVKQVNSEKKLNDEDFGNVFFDLIKSKGKTTFLDLKGVLANRMLSSCNYCENLCSINRYEDQTGFCGVPKETYFTSSFLHRGEEAPIIPSGTIFFAGCSFDCVFCQNEDLSTAGKSLSIETFNQKIGPEQLAEIASLLADKGAININYVGGDPTPNIHTIINSMRFQLKNIGQIWNSNFFNTIPALELLSDVIDLWLPDFKYGNNSCGKKLSGIDNYWDILCRNFKYIYSNGSRNIIIRHLVLPGHLECCSKPILSWIAENIPNVVVNIMAQYRPNYKVATNRNSPLNRKVTTEEMNKIYEYAEKLGLEFRSVS
jgi:putative pyruvate formate lyase activating enzyme